MSFVPDGWQASNSELTGKTILISGASRGIGEAGMVKVPGRGMKAVSSLRGRLSGWLGRHTATST